MFTMKVQIKIKSFYNKTPPKVRISNSNNQYSEFLLIEKINTVEADFDFLPNDELSVEFLNKDDYDDNVVRIEELHIDDINLQHFIFSGVYEPVYNPDWYCQQDPKPPKYFCPGTELRHAGIWRYSIKLPIWKDVMERWLKDER